MNSVEDVFLEGSMLLNMMQQAAMGCGGKRQVGEHEQVEVAKLGQPLSCRVAFPSRVRASSY